MEYIGYWIIGALVLAVVGSAGAFLILWKGGSDSVGSVRRAMRKKIGGEGSRAELKFWHLLPWTAVFLLGVKLFPRFFRWHMPNRSMARKWEATQLVMDMSYPPLEVWTWFPWAVLLGVIIIFWVVATFVENWVVKLMAASLLLAGVWAFGLGLAATWRGNFFGSWLSWSFDSFGATDITLLLLAVVLSIESSNFGHHRALFAVLMGVSIVISFLFWGQLI